MATKLKKMRLTSVDLVRAGANQEADICLFKSADPPEATESPSEGEKNIFKRFIHWLRENPTEAESEPHSHIEKTEDGPDLEYLYKSALAESLHSIMEDPTLTDIEKKEMTEESLRQYDDKIRELERFDEDYDGGDDIDEKLLEEIDDFDKDDDTIEEEIIEEIDDRYDDDRDDDDRYEMLDEVVMTKFNQNHDRSGRFASSGGGGAAVSPAGAGGGHVGMSALNSAEIGTQVKTGNGKTYVKTDDPDLPWHNVNDRYGDQASSYHLANSKEVGGVSMLGSKSSGSLSTKQQAALDHVMNGASAHGYSTQRKAESAAKNIANHQRTDVSIFDFGSTQRKANGRYYPSHGKEAKAIALSGKATKVGTVYPDATNVHSAD